MLSIPSYIEPDFESEPFLSSPDASTGAVVSGKLPDDFYSTASFPTYVKLNGKWTFVKSSRPDAAIRIDSGDAEVVDFSDLKDGDKIVTGRLDKGVKGVYVHSNAFRIESSSEDEAELFRSGFSRETSQTRDYDELYDTLKYDRDEGNIIWALGTACAYDYDSRRAMSNIIKSGYCDALICGSAFATFDLEAAEFNTCQGQDIYTKKLTKNGRYNQLDILNSLNSAGSLENYIMAGNIRDGVMSSAIRENIPTLISGSARDNKFPGAISDESELRKKMISVLSKATTVIVLASDSLTVTASDLTPTYILSDGIVRPVYFFTVDISEFTVNKVRSRGMHGYRGIVTNIQDCLVNLERNLI